MRIPLLDRYTLDFYVGQYALLSWVRTLIHTTPHLDGQRKALDIAEEWICERIKEFAKENTDA